MTKEVEKIGLLVYDGYVLCMDNQNQIIRNGAVYAENGEIVEVGRSEDLRKKYQNADQEVSAEGRVVMPGFICTHMHFYSAFATGIPLPSFPKGFHNVLKHLWWKIDRALLKEDVYYSALLGYIQAVRSGTTTVVDHHSSPSYISGSLDEIERAGRKMGVRSNLCYEVTDRNGKEGANEGVKENERFLKKCKQSDDDMFSGLVGLHASFTLDNSSLSQAQQIVEKFNTGVHVHVAEGKVDMAHAREKYDMTSIERLNQYNLLNSKSILAHCIHLENEDYSIIKKNDVNVSHQPRSNMNNAVGTMNFEMMNNHEIMVGMGTDGMSSDMKTELMTGSLLQKHHTSDNTYGTSEVYNALIKQNPRIIRKIVGSKVGRLTRGFKADLVISDYRPKTPISSDNIVGHVMFGVINEPIHSTIIDGSPIMVNHTIKKINEREIVNKTQQLALNVWNRVANLYLEKKSS